MGLFFDQRIKARIQERILFAMRFRNPGRGCGRLRLYGVIGRGEPASVSLLCRGRQDWNVICKQAGVEDDHKFGTLGED
jgi:hypothetical protein